MDEWITWSDLLEKHKDFVLFEMLKAGIRPFDRYSKEPVHCNYYHHEYYYLFSQYEKLQNIADPEEKEDAFKKRLEKMQRIVNDEPDLRNETKLFPEQFEMSWKYLSVNSGETAKAVNKRLEDAIFKKEEVDKYFGNIKTHPLKKKLRPDQNCKIACREMAEKLWKKDPTLTITAMYNHTEIKKILNNKYIDKTFRNWVKDLCPNRKPGRRSSKSK